MEDPVISSHRTLLSFRDHALEFRLPVRTLLTSRTLPVLTEIRDRLPVSPKEQISTVDDPDDTLHPLIVRMIP